MVEEVRAGALGRAVGLGVVTRRVLAAPVVCAAAHSEHRSGTKSLTRGWIQRQRPALSGPQFAVDIILFQTHPSVLKTSG